MTENTQASLQERFIAALKDKMREFYSVERFAEKVKLKPKLIEEALKGKTTLDHAAMQTIASGVGLELMAFLEYGQELIDRQKKYDNIFSQKTETMIEAPAKKAAPARKKESGAAVIPKPVDQIVEDFGAWARGLARRDPKMAVWLEKQLDFWMKMTDPEFGKAKVVVEKPKDVI